MIQHNHLENLQIIHDQLIEQSTNTNNLIGALEAVKTDDIQSKCIMNIVINALFNNIEMTVDMAGQIAGLLLDQPTEGDCHE